MPYLHCPRCRRTAWVRIESARAVECRHCGSVLDAMDPDEARFLTRAVRERFNRDARLGRDRPRFVRD